MLQCAAFAGPAGPAFSFSAFPRFLSATSLQMETTPFFLTWGLPLPPDSSTTGSHWPNRGCLEVRWCVGPTHLLTSQKPPHRVEFGFAHQNELTPPPKGGGAGYHLGWVCWGFHAEKPGTFPQEKTDTSYPRASLGSCHRQLLVTNGSHGFNRAGLGLRWCRFPTLSPKPHTGPHRGEFGFTAFSWRALGLAESTSPAPACNSPPLGWAGW